MSTVISADMRDDILVNIVDGDYTDNELKVISSCMQHIYTTLIADSINAIYKIKQEFLAYFNMKKDVVNQMALSIKK
jgi:hypothetical protein